MLSVVLKIQPKKNLTPLALQFGDSKEPPNYTKMVIKLCKPKDVFEGFRALSLLFIGKNR